MCNNVRLVSERHVLKTLIVLLSHKKRLIVHRRGCFEKPGLEEEAGQDQPPIKEPSKERNVQ